MQPSSVTTLLQMPQLPKIEMLTEALTCKLMKPNYELEVLSRLDNPQ